MSEVDPTPSSSDTTPPMLSYASSTVAPARIGPFHDLLEAEMAVARLERDGIGATVAGAALATTLGSIYGAAYAGGPFVLVSKTDEPAAREIIDGIEALRRARNATDSPACPACTERRANRTLHPLSWLAIICFFACPLLGGGAWAAALLVGVLLVLCPTQPRWKCQACGKLFAADKPVLTPSADPDSADDSNDEADDDDTDHPTGQPIDKAT